MYQCIARSKTPDGRTDEWVSASAVLALQTDKLITKGKLRFGEVWWANSLIRVKCVIEKLCDTRVPSDR